MLTPSQRWESAILNPKFNTSYPLSPSDWQRYRSEAPLPFSESTLAFYLHIPFCPQLCRFCEYTRTHVPTSDIQNAYLSTLAQDIHRFLQAHGENLSLYGFDIGGGTPTVLSDENFEKLLSIYSEISGSIPLTPDYEPSIEATFSTLTPVKTKLIAQAGIQRLSLGLQSTNPYLLKKYGRHSESVKNMLLIMEKAYREGIRKINLDIMYGLPGQTLADAEQDLLSIAELQPEQITLYEWRSNMLNQQLSHSHAELFRIYHYFYHGLIHLGYYALFGQNTFSRCESDKGCSSYLRHRMIDAAPYKGFGISAQSMSHYGISYNVGKAARHLPLSLSSYDVGDVYLLPPEEHVAKYIAISAYHGRFSLSTASRLLHCDAENYFADELQFCLNNGLLEQNNEIISITEAGFLHYGAVFSLFYPNP